MGEMQHSLIFFSRYFNNVYLLQGNAGLNVWLFHGSLTSVYILLCQNYVTDGLSDKSLSFSRDYNENNATIKSYETTL